jgi:hypothetical protein
MKLLCLVLADGLAFVQAAALGLMDPITDGAAVACLSVALLGSFSVRPAPKFMA